jgi:hypothetical protein
VREHYTAKTHVEVELRLHAFLTSAQHADRVVRFSRRPCYTEERVIGWVHPVGSLVKGVEKPEQSRPIIRQAVKLRISPGSWTEQLRYFCCGLCLQIWRVTMFASAGLFLVKVGIHIFSVVPFSLPMIVRAEVTCSLTVGLKLDVGGTWCSQHTRTQSFNWLGGREGEGMGKHPPHWIQLVLNTRPSWQTV